MCAATWQVKDGIPRFFEPPYYWGEIADTEATSFIEEARQLGWRRAIAQRFAGKEGLRRYVSDVRRASWLPLLGLGSDSIALDVGSGYGAITQSLAAAAGTVYSLEASNQRIEFIRIRLEQENIRNVHLVQGTALQLPFFDEMFDLIVVNGVLEWVGEWQTNKDPRAVQAEFLRSLSRLLKPQGVLVIGIENRISFASFRGAVDHSGLRYTNLMPRSLATMWLRWFGSRYRTNFRKTEYRTYTYTERGYDRLLGDAGLNGRYYWPIPTYNAPHRLVPVSNTMVERDIEANEAARSKPRRWIPFVAGALARTGLLRLFIPTFVIIARKCAQPIGESSEPLWEAIRDVLPATGSYDNPEFTLSHNGRQEKTIINVFDGKNSVPQLVVKSSAAPRGTTIKRELSNLRLIHSRLLLVPDPEFSVPAPLGSFQIGNFDYTVERGISGERFLQLSLVCPQAQRLEYLSNELPRWIAIAVRLGKVLRGCRSVDQVPPSWLRCAPEAAVDANLSAQLHGVCALPRIGFEDCVQHGDFTATNLVIDRQTQRRSVIDWEHMVRGVPPLYDVFSLLLSLLSARVVNQNSGLRETFESRFSYAFFSPGPFAQLFRNMILIACEALGVSPAETWNMFLQSLTLRYNHHLARGSTQQAEEELDCLRFAVDHYEEFMMRDCPRVEDVALEAKAVSV